jgi:hypothetical protein
MVQNVFIFSWSLTTNRSQIERESGFEIFLQSADRLRSLQDTRRAEVPTFGNGGSSRKNAVRKFLNLEQLQDWMGERGGERFWQMYLRPLRHIGDVRSPQPMLGYEEARSSS